MLKEYDVVTLTQPLPEHELPVGTVGTIVHVYSNQKVYEVEFGLGSVYESIVLTLDLEQIGASH